LSENVDYVEDAIKNLSEYLKRSREEAEARLEHYSAKLEMLKRLREIKAKRLEGKPLTLDDAREAQQVTCYGSLAYCCGLEKKCPYSFAAMDALGIDPEDFADFKVNFVISYLEQVVGVTNEEE